LLATYPSLSLSEQIQAEKARRNFTLFVKEAWHVIEPSTPFVPGWHLDAICEHLTAVSNGQILRLLVNMPPRHAKSSIISALWSAWLLLNNPSIRLLCGSYAMNLATRDNLKARRIIKSNWFQARYGHIVQITKDQDAKMRFETDKLGYRMAVSVGGSATGEGGDVLILDDPHNIDEKESDAKRETAVDWFDTTWSSRLNNPQMGAMVVVSHRIHERDVSGHILDTNDGEWVHLNLPAEYDPGSACRTYLPSGKEFWQDPRTEEGQLLWDTRFPRTVIEKAKWKYGPLGYSALFQQNPVPAGGGTFKKQFERVFEVTRDSYLLYTPRGDIKSVLKADCELFLSVDPAISEEQSADFMAVQTWAKTPIKDLLLLHVHRGHWSHPDQQDEVEEQFWLHDNDFVAVETVAYQHALFQDLINKGIPCRPFKPHKDKVARAGTAAIWQQNGKIYFLKGAEWLPELQKELYKFPKASHDDMVDALSLASIVVRSRGPLSDDAEYEEDIPDPIEGPIQHIEEVKEAEQKSEEEEQPSPVARLLEAQKQNAEKLQAWLENQKDPFAYADKINVWGGDE